MPNESRAETPKPRPHDALFKRTFGRPMHATGLLRSLLPSRMADRVDFDTLEVQPGSFVDEVLADRHSDLLYTVNVGSEKTLMYVLAEHQSTMDPLMAMRVLRYVVRIWDQWLVKNPRATRLPPVIPLVIFHGDSGWTAPVEVAELVDLPNVLRGPLGPFVPSLRFILEDLSQRSEASLKAQPQTAVGKLAFFALKRSRQPGDIARDLQRWVKEIELGAAVDLDALVTIFVYLLEVNEATTVESLREHLAPKSDAAKEVIMNSTRRMQAASREEGREEGRHEGQAEVLLKQIRLKFKTDDEDIRNKVLAADLATLDRWTDAILTADSLEAFFGDD